MRFFKQLNEDLRRLKEEYEVHPVMAVLTNRGFHALLLYRMANALYRRRIPLLPLIFSRLVQIFYAIDIDYRATISGGVIIIHGMGTAIGAGAIVKHGVTIYHDVTLGRKLQGARVPPGDGFPTIEENCVLGAGCRILGKTRIGSNCIIGCNTVVTFDVESNSVVKLGAMVIKQKTEPVVNRLVENKVSSQASI